MYGIAHDVTNDQTMPARTVETVAALERLGGHKVEDMRRIHVLPESCEFDEIVVGGWLHVEQMNTGQWWINVGGVTLWVEADRDGRPKLVSVSGPEDYDEPVPGCRYEVKWTDAATLAEG